MKFIPPTSRKEATAFGRPYHYYIDGNNTRIPGVTTILGGGIPKPKLIDWAARATAEGAIDQWDELSDLKPAARLARLKEIRYDTTNQAKNKGTQVHSYAERLVQGEEVADIPPELRPYAENYARFLDEWNVQPILVETVVVNYTHGYAGTLDLLADLTMPNGDTQRWLLDVKTGETGIYPETALQLAAYRNAEAYIDNHGHEQDMIRVQACGAVHVTSDDAVLIPTAEHHDYENDDGEIKTVSVYTDFRYAKKIYELAGIGDQLIKAPILQPVRSSARLIWANDE